MVRTALSIAGSDPSGGAGIQADLKAMSANGVYGMAAITALTAQNTRGVRGVRLVEPDFVAAQIRTVVDDIRVDAVKIGMVASAEIAAQVAQALDGVGAPIVLDPVMVAKSGDPLLEPDAVIAIRERLLPIATVVTPNLPEAATLLGDSPPRHADEMPWIAERLHALGPQTVLLKGGHLDGAESPDFLALGGGGVWLEGARHATANTHGTGCTLSAALAARLALGEPLETAARTAKAYVADAIAAADGLGIGHGAGPTHHFHALWRD